MGPSLRLSKSTAVPYLLSRGLLSAECVVDGGLTLVDQSRRNHNLQVSSDRAPSYVLKQTAPQGGSAVLDREAAVYERLTHPAEGAPMAPFLPRCYGYDSEAGILVIELVRHAETLVRYHGRLGRCPVAAGRAMGAVLGCLHSRVPLAPAELAAGSRAPWVFSLVTPERSLLRNSSMGCVQVVRALHRFPAFRQLLADLGQEWRTECFIHGDLKWDHFLLAGGSLKLVDWELAGPGDPTWDVGAVFAEYLTFWTSGMAAGGGPSRFPLSQMQPAVRAFWQAYVRAAGVPATARAQHLHGAVRYCGARLLQNAYQQMQQGTQLTEQAVVLLQLSWNVLQRPRDAAAMLLGAPASEVGEE